MKLRFREILLALLLIIAAGCQLSWADSYAPIAVGDSIKITNSYDIVYGTNNESTVKKQVKTPSDGKTRNAYCVQPWLPTPGNSTRELSELWTSDSSGRFKQVMRILCYYSDSYAGDEWADNNWYINRAGTSDYDMKWIDTSDEKIAVVHLAMSMAWWQEKQGSSLAKMPSFQSGTVKGNSYPKYWNAAYAIYRAAEASAAGKANCSLPDDSTIKVPANAPDRFAACLIKVSGKQNLVFGTYGVRFTGKLKLTKSSTDEELTAGNDCYSFKDVEYKVYKDAACTRLASSTSLKCNQTSGVSNSIELEEGSYYLKESKAGTSYQLDTRAHKIVVKRNKMTNADASMGIADEPRKVAFTFYKCIDDSEGDSGEAEGFSFILRPLWNNEAEVYTASSDANGRVDFGSIPMGRYQLSEAAESLIKGNRVYKPLTNCESIRISSAMDSLPAAVSEDGKFHNGVEQADGAEIIIRKIIVDENGRELNLDLSGFEFECEDISVSTDASGMAVIKGLEAGTYQVRERLSSSQEELFTAENNGVNTVQLDTRSVVVEQRNVISTHEIKLKKTSSDGRVGGVVFSLSGRDCFGNELEPVMKATDENGELSWGRYVAGEYVIEECDFDADRYIFAEEYRLEGHSRPALAVSVDSQGMKLGGKRCSCVEFNNQNYSIKLRKTEALEDGTLTDAPVEGAEYGLYRVETGSEEDGSSTATEILVAGPELTDENGELEFEVEKGEYRLREIGVPNGYIGDENNERYVDITLNAASPVVELEGSELTVNQREYGTINVIKENSETRERLEGAVIGLYSDDDCTVEIDRKTSDEDGRLSFAELEWGDYYVKEIKAPQGFELSDEVSSIRIGRYKTEEWSACVDADLLLLNNPMPGSVRLSKVDEANGEHRIGGASYSLYTAEGELVEEQLVTDENGEILVEELEWGAYYFEETEAPQGYGLSENRARFTINAKSASRTQTVVDKEPLKTNEIVASIKLKSEDIWFAHGAPCWVVELVGTDMSGNEHSYNRLVSFSEEYVSRHTDENGFVSSSVSFNDVPAGNYILGESKVERYELSTIYDISSNARISGESVEIDLTDTDANQSSYATFYNVKNDWNQLSDQTQRTNIVKKSTSYTALSVDYRSSAALNSGMLFGEDERNEYIKAYAVYDDGNEELLEADEYSLYNEDGTLFTRVPIIAGVYTITARHSEKNTEHSATFTITVNSSRISLLQYDANGGTAAPRSEEFNSEDELIVSELEPTRDGYAFLGWADTKNADESSNWYDPATLLKAGGEESEDITLYAQWFDIDSLEEEYTSFVQDGDLMTQKGGCSSKTINSGSYGTVTLTAPDNEGYRTIGTVGYRTSEMCRVVKMTAGSMVIRNVGSASTTRTSSNTYGLYLLVKERTGQSFLQMDTDARITQLCELANNCLSYNDIKTGLVQKKVTDNVIAASQSNSVNNDGMALLGFSIKNAADGGRYANRVFAYTAMDSALNVRSAHSSYTSVVDIIVYNLEKYHETGSFAYEQTDGPLGKARYIALKELENGRENYFSASQIKVSDMIRSESFDLGAWETYDVGEDISIPDGMLLGVSEFGVSNDTGGSGYTYASINIYKIYGMGEQNGMYVLSIWAANKTIGTNTGNSMSNVYGWGKVLYISSGELVQN